LTNKAFSKKTLEDGIKNTKLPLPFYDSLDIETRKQIGEVTHLEVTEDNMIGFTANLKDGKIIKGKTL